MPECGSELIKWLSSRPWSLDCNDVTLDCEKVDSWTLIKEMGCGETAVAFVSSYGRPDTLDSTPQGLSELLRGFPSRVRSTCGAMEIDRLEPLSTSPRASTYEAYLANGSKVLVKVLRRLEQDNVEHLVLEYLSGSGFTKAPKYVCHVELDGSLLALVTSFADGEPAASAYVTAASKLDPGPVRDMSREIGKAVSELHQTLMLCDEQWCRPEPITEADVSSWLSRISWRSRWLRSRGVELVPPHEKSLVIEAADSLDELAGSALSSAMLHVGRFKLRIHGDLHLYQIIITESGLQITDFEGEPYKEPASKLEKEHPFRDLAALARSVDYAAVMGAQIRHGVSLAVASSEYIGEVSGWEVEVFNEMLDGYVKRLRETNSPLAEEPLRQLLQFWIIERASYEAVYELRAHTGYHEVPLNAIIRMSEGSDPLLRYVSSKQ